MTKPGELWQQRVAALKNLPGVMCLVWRTAPGIVATTIFLRFAAALIPVAMLAVSRRIVDAVNVRSATHTAASVNIWPLLWMEFGLAAGALILSRAIDYCDSLLADRFTHTISLRVMQRRRRSTWPTLKIPASTTGWSARVSRRPAVSPS